MISRALVVLCTLLFSVSSYAFTCYITLVKDNCWANFDVNVAVIDADNNNTLATLNVPPAKQWVRQSFNCNPGQTFTYAATFSPIIWQAEKGRVYHPKQFITLPASVGPGQSAWNIPLCFPAAFAEVPMPLTATGNCQCNFKAVPAIPLGAF